MSNETIEHPAHDADDATLVLALRSAGQEVAAARLELYAGLAPGQRRLSEDVRATGIRAATALSYEGIPFLELTCDDAVAVAAIMALRAKQAKDEQAMPRLILPGGVRG